MNEPDPQTPSPDRPLAKSGADGAVKQAATGQSQPGQSSRSRADAVQRRDFTSGLKQLYDAVVDEPLPQQFADLLARLDAGQAEQPAAKNSGRPAADDAR